MVGSSRSVVHNPVDRGQVEVELAGILRLELPGLQLNHKITVQTHVIEEQVHIEGLISNRERHLTADEGEAAAKLQQQVAQVE